MVLSRDVISDTGITLMAVNTMLNDRNIMKLRLYDIQTVYVKELADMGAQNFSEPIAVDPEKPERIKALFDNTMEKMTKKMIAEKCPDISISTIERTLTLLAKDGYIIKIEAGKKTAYIRNADYQ
jgi:hypothetical protein